MKELESILSDLLGGGLLLALGSGGHHAGLEEDPFKHNIVLRKVEEDRCPHLLSHLESPVDAMISVKQDLRLDNWDEAVVLQVTNFCYNLRLCINTVCIKYMYVHTWEMAA